MSERMNTQEFMELCAHTTRGQWQASLETIGSNDIVHDVFRVRNEFGDIIADECSTADAHFIAGAHNMVPALLSRISELEAQNERMRQRVGECARLIRDYMDIVHRMEVIQNEMQSAAQAKKKRPRRRNPSYYC